MVASESGNELVRISDFSNHVSCVAFTASGMLLAGGLDETLRIYGTTTPVLNSFPVDFCCPLTSCLIP